ncbi:flagellar hook-length control protein FliK [Burkholderia thailandensis]|uniref:Flagellar hook-length control FliK family protein n=4 Tax=Burkholderia thailandensis TaxID=57975 RepID=A0AAW9CZ81_BURTH|nr:flagellar hook-length control protein FliK [Burkholderia thailandensis]MCS3390726.1 flagellar hook-length control protein FliK [Burkholderia thailandensis]MCS6424613.1 flagellar hook-length control protein FliK [Burkholderia thailandensis]MCS6451840.1 flagellar hook-length control protein FliK [Burkholderia thailandensis]MCS6463928.1 flagellar hook-length control protein FliK [Burkholderia thailandensis]MCS6481526.1 flagellar hook-length control protein FliK [Burkholderia thailandensis]
MPPLPLIGMLLGAASTMIKSSSGAAAHASGASSAPSGDAAPTAPFAQTLKQNVQTQRQTNSGAPNAGNATNAATSGTANASTTSSASEPATTNAGNTKASGKPDDQDDDKNATQSASADAAAALAAAASLQAQLQARPDAQAAQAAQAAAPQAGASDAAHPPTTLATNTAAAGDADTSALAGAQQPVGEALNAALSKLTGAGPAGAAATQRAQPAGRNDGAPTPLAANGPFDKMLAGAKAPAAPATLTDASGTNPAVSTAAQPAASGAIAALQDAADSARATLAASSAPAALQQAAPAALAANANAAAATAAPSLAPPVGTPDWTEALSQKVVFLSNAHQQSAELTLNPPDLGPLQVVLRVAENHAHALFVSQHAQVRDAVEAALPKLREAMEAGGLGLGSASVSDGGFASAQQQQTPQRQSSDGSAARRASGAPTADAALGEVSAVSSGGATRRSVGMVDTFA